MGYGRYTVTTDDFSIKRSRTNSDDEFGDKEQAKARLQKNLVALADYQDKLYSEGKEGLLIVVQAMDAAGKDGVVKHVFTAFNPAGVNVYSFKQPNREELAHDYLWRVCKVLPERGKIAVFNRSYYEDVLIGRVHKLYANQNAPKRATKGKVIERRYEEIRNFERYVYDNGTTIVKIFLNLSEHEQERRFLSRIDDKSKNWKFSESDIEERGYWKEYMRAYEDAINATATDFAPWYVVPADDKWYARCLISEIVRDTLKKMNPKYPTLPEDSEKALSACRELLVKDNPLPDEPLEDEPLEEDEASI